MTADKTTTVNIEEGLDFILSHFEEPLWPRTISTKTTEGKQILVNSKTEALVRISQSNYLDCRISAYPPNVLENPSAAQRFVGIRTVTPATLTIMIDLDKCNFKTERGFKIVLTRILANIKDKLNVTPTVLWSGRGHHIMLPMNSNGIVLENVKQFEGISNVSLKFLRFAEQYLSLRKSDPQHNSTVSFNNCMLRIPGSINSKNGETVSIIQRWDLSRPEINYLLATFTRYIINEQYMEFLKAQKREKLLNHTDKINLINWIERLLRTSLADNRKYCIWRILAPYFLNKRKLTRQESFAIISDWLDRCDQMRRIDFNVRQRINDGLNGARDGYMPIKFEKLKEENEELYYLLRNQDLNPKGKEWGAAMHVGADNNDLS
jgi:hypothetical protein